MQLAFESNRSGFTEIWIATTKDGQARRLTSLATSSGSPRWSPGGDWIVFDARLNGTSKIFKIASSGGIPIPLTSGDSATDMLPVWSSDGRSIYFSSNRSGEYRIWQISADGPKLVPVTSSAATAPELSPDGQFLYYLQNNYVDSDLWRRNMRTGNEIKIAGAVCFRGFALGKTALYFLTRNASSTLDLYRLDPPTGRVNKVTELPNTLVGGLAVSSDDRFLYFAELDHSGDELMLVNNFE